MELHCQWPHCLRPDTTVPWPNSHWVLYGFPPEEEVWGGHVQHCEGCPDTSPRAQSHSALRSRPLSALGSWGNPRQKTMMLASNSRAPRPKDASFPCSLCYCVSSFPSFFFFDPIDSTRMTWQFVQRKIDGVEEGVMVFNSSWILIHLSQASLSCKC